jgi:hypothetical protein
MEAAPDNGKLDSIISAEIEPRESAVKKRELKFKNKETKKSKMRSKSN